MQPHLIDWLIHWLIDKFDGRFVDWLIDWGIQRLIDWLNDWLIDWLIVSFPSLQWMITNRRRRNSPQRTATSTTEPRWNWCVPFSGDGPAATGDSQSGQAGSPAGGGRSRVRSCTSAPSTWRTPSACISVSAVIASYNSRHVPYFNCLRDSFLGRLDRILLEFLLLFWCFFVGKS